MDLDPVPPPHHLSQESSIPTEIEDDDSLATNDYVKILKQNQIRGIPHRVNISNQDTTHTNTVSDDSQIAVPFPSASSLKALPKYSGHSTSDINEFIYKLKPFLQHKSIDNCHLLSSTTDAAVKQSKNLAALLSMCLSGPALSPFIDNPTYDDKGIEMLNHLMDLKHPVSTSSAATIYNSLHTQKIAKDDSFDAFAKRLRLTYKTCTRSGIPYNEGFLIRCFINRLNSNFAHTQEMLDCNVLKWYDLTLNEVIVLANETKLNKIATGTWTTDVASANVSTGKQGAKRPTSVPSDQSPSVVMDPEVPAYLYKPSKLTFKEVRSLLERYACPICRKNNHAFHTCHAVKTTYNISLICGNNNNSSRPSDTTTSSNNTSTTSTPVAANRVSTSVQVVTDNAERYDGFESVAVPPPDSDTDESTDNNAVDALQNSVNMSKLNHQ